MKKLIFIFVLAFVIPSAIWAQGNAFSFQGRLNEGTSPANGAYDLEFRLFPTVQGGTPIGNTVVSRPNTALINGVFSVMLDFGANAFNNPNSVFIEISVRPNGSPNAYTILGPRQQLTVVPFSVRAANATNADNAQTAVNATSAATSTLLNGLTSSDFIRNQTTPQANSNFNISGNGFINGNLNLVGNTFQNRDKGGFVKAMVFVDIIYGPGTATPVIARCFNGVTVASTPDCGFTVQATYNGKYIIDFGFPINDRFYSVTPQQFANVNTGYNITAGFFFPGNPNQLGVKTNVADVTFPDSFTDSQFMLIVY
jgi:hypothetical protein